MRKCTIRTILYPFPAFSCYIPRCSRTILIAVHGTITKKAVEILPFFYLMTWVIFTLVVLKIPVAVLCHNSLLITSPNILINTYRFVPNLIWCICLSIVKTYIMRMLPFICHLPKRIFYYNRCIIPYTKFYENNILIFMSL